MGGLLGKTILVTGIITDSSIAFHVAKVAQEQGAKVLITGFDRLRLIDRIAQRLPQPVPPAISLNVQSSGGSRLSRRACASWLPRVSTASSTLIGFAPPLLPGKPVHGRAVGRRGGRTFEVSAYSYSALAKALLPVLNDNASIVGMDFDPARDAVLQLDGCLQATSRPSIGTWPKRSASAASARTWCPPARSRPYRQSHCR
ncbi:SDR family oxidoreductase [Rhodococcus sp. 3Y1]